VTPTHPPVILPPSNGGAVSPADGPSGLPAAAQHLPPAVPTILPATANLARYNAARGCYEPQVFFGLATDWMDQVAQAAILFTHVVKMPARREVRGPGGWRYFEVTIVARRNCLPVIVNIQDVRIEFYDQENKPIGSLRQQPDAMPVKSGGSNVRGISINDEDVPEGTRYERVTYTVHIVDKCTNSWTTVSWDLDLQGPY